MSEFRRRQMMSVGGGSKPYDAEIEYLESSGTQYIDTGVPATYDLTEMETVILFKNTDYSVGRFLAANYILEDSNPRCYLLERQKSPIGIRATNQNDKTFQSSKAIVVSASDNKFITVTSSISQSQVVLGSQTINNSTSGADGSNNYYMYCLNSNGNATSYVKCQCKYCKIKKNNILVRDFIPVRVGQVGYMYDNVSGQLFGNQGTGNFVLGPDK